MNLVVAYNDLSSFIRMKLCCGMLLLILVGSTATSVISSNQTNHHNLIPESVKHYAIRERKLMPKIPSDEVVFIEKDGLVIIEAESVPIGKEWKFETKIANFTGKGYYRFDGNSIQTGPPVGKMSYKIMIGTIGTYHLLIRSFKNHKDTTWSNDCYTRLNGHEGYQGTLLKTFTPGKSFQWNYKVSHEVTHTNKRPVYYSFNKTGIYTLDVYGRSKNFVIDRFILFQKKKYTEGYSSNPNLTESKQLK